MKTYAYQPRPAGRHVRSTPDGKLTRDGEFTDHNATAAPPAAEQQPDKTPAAETPATPVKTKGK
jgi:hypothetical protein